MRSTSREPAALIARRSWSGALGLMLLAGCSWLFPPAERSVRLPARSQPRQPAVAQAPAPRPREPEFCYLYLSVEPLVSPNPLSVTVQCPQDRLQRVQRALAWLYVPAAQGGDEQTAYLVYQNRHVWRAAEHTAGQMLASPPPIVGQLIGELRPSGLVDVAALEPLLAALLRAQGDPGLAESWRWCSAMWRGRLLLVQGQDPPAAAEAFADAQRIAPSGSPQDLAASAAWIEMLADQDHLDQARGVLTGLEQRCGGLMDSAAGSRARQLPQASP